MRIFMTRWFAKFARKEEITCETLAEAVRAIEAGGPYVDYGGGVIKKRIARAGSGASGGFRTIIVYRQGAKAFFVFGFAKSSKANISSQDVAGFKELSKQFLALNDGDLERLSNGGKLIEIDEHGEKG